MTKHVVSSDQVMHLWAHQAQSDARNSKVSVSFDGVSLKSYCLTIGHIVQDCYGSPVALIRDRYSSTTTQHHISMAHGAIRGNMPSFSVPEVDSVVYGISSAHLRNVGHYLKLYSENIAKARRARDYGGYRLTDAQQAMAYARDYAITFGLDGVACGVLSWGAVALEVKAVEEHWAARERKAADPKTIAANERKRERERNKLCDDWRNCTGKFGPDVYLNYRDRERYAKIMTAADNEARARMITIANADHIEAWRNGTSFRLPHGLATIIRIRGEVIQTSRGAEFPVAHARLAFPVVARCRAQGEGWQSNGHTVHLGHFKLDRIDADGTVHAGCHTVAWEEVERCARELGLLGSANYVLTPAQTAYSAAADRR